MSDRITFLFFHYGKVPRYLSHAIEHVRIFNPNAEIILVTDGIKDVKSLRQFRINHHDISDFPSSELEEFRKSYRHVSCFNERYERFVLERWFITETIRRQRPERVYIMIDSDVAVFGDASTLLKYLPDCPIALSGNNPHFTFVRGSISSYLHFILEFYKDESQLMRSRQLHEEGKKSPQIYNLGEMTFLYEFMIQSSDMQTYPTDTPIGYVDVNIHIPESFESLKLRRRPRKKVYWKTDGEYHIPYFLRNRTLVRSFLLHFQGPGKRVFFRFNKANGSKRLLKTPLLNIIFTRSLSRLPNHLAI
jgi:inhibitor of KinA sporulation pathway (predicted exonuclease)